MSRESCTLSYNQSGKASEAEEVAGHGGTVADDKVRNAGHWKRRETEIGRLGYTESQGLGRREDWGSGGRMWTACHNSDWWMWPAGGDGKADAGLDRGFEGRGGGVVDEFESELGRKLAYFFWLSYGHSH